MNVLSVCSGVGGLDLGLHRAGMTPVGFCEFNPPARSVIARHWPDVPIWKDLTTLEVCPGDLGCQVPDDRIAAHGSDVDRDVPRQSGPLLDDARCPDCGGVRRGRVDLVAGGTPCTDLSVAGRRAGLDGEHSRIFWDFCRVADHSAAAWVLWENVAGALSSNNGKDFAAVLWGLTGHRPAVPEDGWRTIGVCVGPRRTAVWRLLDARWFGVAQRRRRVFVVAGAPDVCSLEILVEPEGVPRGAPPSQAAGQDVAAAPGTSTYSAGSFGGWVDGPGCLRAANPFTHLAVLSFAWQAGIGSVADAEGDPRHTLVANQSPAVATGLAVRRLTPVECERLMSWPDDWTRWAADGRELADSHRYRFCGNGVVSNCTEWIGRRLMRAAA